MNSTQAAALLQEFIARKEQVLNLETRQLVLFICLEVVFLLLVFLPLSTDARHDRRRRAAVGLVLLAIGLHLSAINAKMTMTAKYLATLEGELDRAGAGAVVWDQSVVPNWIFGSFNAFTVSVGLLATLLGGQILYGLSAVISALAPNLNYRYVFALCAVIIVGWAVSIAQLANVEIPTDVLQKPAAAQH